MKDYLNREANVRIFLNESFATAQGPKRDLLYALSTALWYREVKRLSACKTNNELEFLLEKNTRGENEYGEPFHFNKWRKYEFGLSRPSRKMVEITERKIPGCSVILYHPLWEILRKGFSENRRPAIWFSLISQDIQRIILPQGIATATFPITQYYRSKTQLQMLERRAGLDALACLSLLLIDAIQTEQSALALDVSRSLFRSLLLVCMTKPYNHLEDWIFYCFAKYLLNYVSHAGERIALRSIGFSDLTTLLQWKILSLEDAGVLWRTKEDLFQGYLRILNGKYGIELGRRFLLPMEKEPQL